MKRTMLTAIMISACMFSMQAADMSDEELYRETLKELSFLKREALPLPCKKRDELDIISAPADNNACDTQAGNDDFKKAKECYGKKWFAEGRKHLFVAANKGHVYALRELGKILQAEGKQDIANECFHRAAQRGDVPAMKILRMLPGNYTPEPRFSEAEIYLMSHGVTPEDFNRAASVANREWMYQHALFLQNKKSKLNRYDHEWLDQHAHSLQHKKRKLNTSETDALDSEEECTDEINFIVGN